MSETDETLDLSHNDVEIFDSTIYNNPQICKKLNLSHNNIVIIDVMLNFCNLQFLDLKFNKLKCIPKLQQLFRLETIDLSFNEITSLEGLASSSLIKADLSFNKIMLLDGLNKSPKLTHLIAANNQICEVRSLSMKHYVS